MQLTFGPRRFSGSDEIGELPFSAEYGITDRWQVEVEYTAFSRVHLDPSGEAQGHGDVEIGTKYAFMQIAGSDTHAAVGVSATIPSGSVARGLSEGLVEVEPFVCAAHDFRKLARMQLFGQAGVTLVHRVHALPADESGDDPGDGGDVAPTDPHELFLNVGAFVPIRSFRATLELNWTTNQWNHEGDQSSLYVTPGVVWEAAPGWELGFGVPIGASHDADRARVIGMVIYEFDTRKNADEDDH